MHTSHSNSRPFTISAERGSDCRFGNLVIPKIVSNVRSEQRCTCLIGWNIFVRSLWRSERDPRGSEGMTVTWNCLPPFKVSIAHVSIRCSTAVCSTDQELTDGIKRPEGSCASRLSEPTNKSNSL